MSSKYILKKEDINKGDPRQSYERSKILIQRMIKAKKDGGNARDINEAGNCTCYSAFFQRGTKIFEIMERVCRTNSCSQCAVWVASNIKINGKKGNIDEF